MADTNIFTYINAISYKREMKYDKSLAPAYMLMLWFSHDRTLLPILNDINQYLFGLPDDVVYDYLYSTVPSGKRYLKWVKKDKSEKEESLEKELQVYNISKKEMMLYNKF